MASINSNKKTWANLPERVWNLEQIPAAKETQDFSELESKVEALEISNNSLQSQIDALSLIIENLGKEDNTEEEVIEDDEV